jgi:hypothetical protein
MFGGICELVLESRDPGVLERFYRRLGLAVLTREHDRVWLAAGERARLGIWAPGTKEHADRGLPACARCAVDRTRDGSSG